MAIVKSPTADAINVPACFWFFSTGAIAALYMLVVNEDRLAFAVICLHICLGNLTQGVLALYKQQRYKRILNSTDETRRSTTAQNDREASSSGEG